MNKIIFCVLFCFVGCATLPPDVAKLSAENDKLRQRLEQCQALAAECADLVEECNSLLGD